MPRALFRLDRQQFQRILNITWQLLFVTSAVASQPATNDSQSNLVNANNKFAIALFRDIESAAAGKNHFVSPFSIESALLMTAEGARGETVAEMGQALQLPKNLQTLDASQPWNLSLLRLELQGLYKRLVRVDDPSALRLQAELKTLRDKLAIANAKARELSNLQQFREAQSQQAEAAKLAALINRQASQVDHHELLIANAIWAEKTFPINPNFVKIVSTFYGTSGAFSVDFKGAPETQREAINGWISDQTKEKIKEVIQKGVLDSSTRMVLANAIYFKGTWSQPFEESATKVGPFTTRDGQQLQVPLMSQQSKKASRYGAFLADGTIFETPTTVEPGTAEQSGYPGADGFQMVELPYSGDRVSMLIVLPRRADGLEKLSALLTADRLSQWDQALAQREFHITLPKYKLETSYSLNESLNRMGMVRAFDDSPGVADFSGLCAGQNPEHQLYISAVLHKAFVEVNEAGTEAAAATVVIMSPTGAPLRSPFMPSFNADHPFLFLIREKQSGLILFIGKVEAP